MGWPVVTVASGGLPVTDASATGFGTPIEEAANGFGTPITFVSSGGLPVVGGAAAPIQTSAIVSSAGARAVLTFTKDGFFYTPKPITIRALVVAGGGGGSSGGGGGGAVRANDSLTLPAGLYQIRIGTGGLGAGDTNSLGANGLDSSFFGMIAKGGAPGGSINATPAPSGGTGGGVGATSSTPLVGGTGSQGGKGGSNPSFLGAPFPSAGGGGAGGDGLDVSNATVGSDGGIGFQTDITGSTAYFGGGGGGTVFQATGTPGNGGLGGGANGSPVGNNGLNGAPNTGGGGGGVSSGKRGGDGADGCVVLNFAAAVQATPGMYLGQVSTRCFLPNTTQASATGWNSVTAHIAKDDISELIVGDINWYVFNNAGDLGQGGTQTITRTVEYPPGTFTRMKWLAASSAVNVDGGTIFTDALPISIPVGATFKLHKYMISSVNLLYCSNSSAIPNTALGEGVNNANVDQTGTGTVVDNTKGFLIPTPIILARTNKPSIAALGSSRMSGNGDASRATSNDAGYARMFGPSFAYLNYGCGGDSVHGLVVGLKRFALAKYCSHLWIDPGLNDLISFAGSAAQMTGDIGTVAGRWPSLAKVIINNEAADTTSTDAWATTVNQTVAAIEAQRVILNTNINALVGYNQIVNANAFDGNGTNNQFWKNPAVGGSQFTVDGLHETTAALVAMVAANTFNPALVTNP